MIFGFAIENHAKTGLVLFSLPRVNTRGYKYYAPNGAYNHAAVWRIFDMDVSCVYIFFTLWNLKTIPQGEFDILCFCFVMIFGFAIENHAKTGLVLFSLPRVNTRGYQYYAPNGAFNHAAVW